LKTTFLLSATGTLSTVQTSEAFVSSIASIAGT